MFYFRYFHIGRGDPCNGGAQFGNRCSQKIMDKMLSNAK